MKTQVIVVGTGGVGSAALYELAKRGVPVGPDVRRPLRKLTEEEQRELEQWLESSSPVPVP